MYFSRYLNSFKQDLQSIWNTYKIPLTIAFAHFVLSSVFQIDRLFFEYKHYNSKIILIKILYFICLLISWCFVFYVKKQIKYRNQFYIRFLNIFCLYLSISFVLLIIIWPGTWDWDDIWTLKTIMFYTGLNPWQHILSGLYLDVLLNIIPIVGGVIFLQLILISVIVAFIITKMEVSFNLPKVKYNFFDILIKCIPFLLPPIIQFQYSGYRIGLCMYLELCAVVIIVCTKKEKDSWTCIKLLFFAFLCTIIATWRSESAFYLPMISILILFVNKKVITKIQKISFIGVFIFGFIFISVAQKKALINDNYLLISLSNISTELVHHVDRVKFKKELDTINKIIPIDIIDKNPKATGTQLYWAGYINNNIKSKDVSEYISSIVKLCFVYPKVFFNERNRYFVGSMNGGLCTLDTTDIFDLNTHNKAAIAYVNSKWILKFPISIQLRKTFLETIFLAKNLSAPLAKIMWNNFIPTVFIALVTLVLLVKKYWFYSFILLIVLSKIVCIYLTLPASFFMYFVSYYLLGYSLLIFTIFKFLTQLQHFNK